MSGGKKPSVHVGDVLHLKDGICTVVEYINAGEITVQFEDGAIAKGSAQQLRKRSLQNPSKFPCKGDMFSAGNQDWVVLEYISANKVSVQCLEDGYTRVSRVSEIKSGRIQNPFFKRVAGVGFIGDGPYSSKNDLTCYQKWSGMLHRVYDSTRICYRQYGGRGVLVHESWHNFQNFAEWFYKQPNNDVKNIELDKDLIDTAAKLYSENTCSLVPKEVNIALTDSRIDNGMLVGVSKTANKINSYRARCHIGGKIDNIGVYSTELQAYLAYVKCKESYVRSLSEKYKDVLTNTSYEALRNWRVV